METKKDEQAQTNKTVLQSKWQLQKFSSQLWKQLCRNDINCGGASESGREYVNAITPTRLQYFYWIIIGIIQTSYGKGVSSSLLSIIQIYLYVFYWILTSFKLALAKAQNLGFRLDCWKCFRHFIICKLEDTLFLPQAWFAVTFGSIID